jgi:DNA mismatch repair ATPase MutL
VENAADAGATSIIVEIQGGGIRLIRVTDNGSGIERADVANAFLRHATSKVRVSEDLSILQPWALWGGSGFHRRDVTGGTADQNPG